MVLWAVQQTPVPHRAKRHGLCYLQYHTSLYFAYSLYQYLYPMYSCKSLVSFVHLYLHHISCSCKSYVYCQLTNHNCTGTGIHIQSTYYNFTYARSYAHTQKRTHMQRHTRTRTHEQGHTHKRMHTHVHTHICTLAHTHTHTQTLALPCTHAHTCTRTHARMHAHAHSHTHTHTRTYQLVYLA